MDVGGERNGTVGLITLDHPAKRNALSPTPIEEMRAAMADLPAARVRAFDEKRQPQFRGE